MDTEGWESHVIGLSARGPFAAVPPDRIYCTGTGTLAQRVRGRLTKRTPERRFAETSACLCPRPRIGLLHAHFGWAGNYAAPLAELLGVPLVVTFYGTDASEPASSYDDLFDRAQRVIAVSDYVKQHLGRLGYDGPVDVIRNGLPLERLDTRTAPPPTEGGLCLLCVGRLVPFKGADVLLRAMPTILAAHPKAAPGHHRRGIRTPRF